MIGFFETGAGQGRRILWATIAVATAVAIPCMLMSRSHVHVGQQKRATADIQMLLMALDDFASSHDGRYPADLNELFTKDAINNPYLVKFNGHIPKDAWGHSFGYELPTEAHPRPRLLSYGEDGKPGGTDEDADTSSDDLKFKF